MYTNECIKSGPCIKSGLPYFFAKVCGRWWIVPIVGELASFSLKLIGLETLTGGTS
jgi:hypothetical protein